MEAPALYNHFTMATQHVGIVRTTHEDSHEARNGFVFQGAVAFCLEQSCSALCALSCIEMDIGAMFGSSGLIPRTAEKQTGPDRLLLAILPFR